MYKNYDIYGGLRANTRTGQSCVNETEVFENKQKSPLINGKTR